MTSVVVAHRLRLLREGICRSLAAGGRETVVGEAEDGLDAVSLVKRLDPDVAVLDSLLPRLNGLDASVELRREAPESRIVLLVGPEDESLAASALRAGASGVVLTNGPLDDLVAAVDRVGGGGRYLSPELTERVLESLAADGKRDDTLTLREREVLQLLAEGGSTREIAEALHISARTVEGHRKHIMGKLRIHSVARLTKYAIRNHLTSLEA